jgi:hypothetical protein
MTEKEIELVCTTVMALGLMALLGWMAYIHKR